MRQRTVSAIILLAILIASLVISSSLFGIVMSLFAVMGFRELFQIRFKDNKVLMPVMVLGILMVLFICLNNLFYKVDFSVSILLPLFVLTLPIIFYEDNKLYNITDALYVLGSVYFLGLSFGMIIFMRSVSIPKCIFIFIISFITDTYAYIGGNLIGKTHFSKISPNKTLEGSIIGALVATVIGTVYYFNVVGGVTIYESLMLCLFLSIISEFGDLLFSSIKRYFLVKDYSNLIPGHGGILDRFDSVIYVSLALSLIFSLF